LSKSQSCSETFLTCKMGEIAFSLENAWEIGCFPIECYAVLGTDRRSEVVGTKPVRVLEGVHGQGSVS
jgi:hypothetical protein